MKYSFNTRFSIFLLFLKYVDKLASLWMLGELSLAMWSDSDICMLCNMEVVLNLVLAKYVMEGVGHPPPVTLTSPH